MYVLSTLQRLLILRHQLYNETTTQMKNNMSIQRKIKHSIKKSILNLPKFKCTREYYHMSHTYNTCAIGKDPINALDYMGTKIYPTDPFIPPTIQSIDYVPIDQSMP